MIISQLSRNLLLRNSLVQPQLLAASRGQLGLVGAIPQASIPMAGLSQATALPQIQVRIRQLNACFLPLTKSNNQEALLSMML